MYHCNFFTLKVRYSNFLITMRTNNIVKNFSFLDNKKDISNIVTAEIDRHINMRRKIFLSTKFIKMMSMGSLLNYFFMNEIKFIGYSNSMFPERRYDIHKI